MCFISLYHWPMEIMPLSKPYDLKGLWDVKDSNQRVETFFPNPVRPLYYDLPNRFFLHWQAWFSGLLGLRSHHALRQGNVPSACLIRLGVAPAWPLTQTGEQRHVLVTTTPRLYRVIQPGDLMTALLVGPLMINRNFLTDWIPGNDVNSWLLGSLWHSCMDRPIATSDMTFPKKSNTIDNFLVLNTQCNKCRNFCQTR